MLCIVLVWQDGCRVDLNGFRERFYNKWISIYIVIQQPDIVSRLFTNSNRENILIFVPEGDQDGGYPGAQIGLECYFLNGTQNGIGIIMCCGSGNPQNLSQDQKTHDQQTYIEFCFFHSFTPVRGNFDFNDASFLMQNYWVRTPNNYAKSACDILHSSVKEYSTSVTFSYSPRYS